MSCLWARATKEQEHQQCWSSAQLKREEGRDEGNTECVFEGVVRTGTDADSDVDGTATCADADVDGEVLAVLVC